MVSLVVPSNVGAKMIDVGAVPEKTIMIPVLGEVKILG